MNVFFVCVSLSSDGMDACHYTVWGDGEVWKMRGDSAKLAVVIKLALQ